ncbi:MAG: efflux RND transporter periplasmic adaptor subunit [Bryobacteraceae bacterium]
MKTTFVALASLIALWSCGSKPTGSVEATAPPKEAAPPKSEGSSSEVKLDAAAQKQAGISSEAVTIRSVPETIRTTGRIVVNEERTWKVGAMTDGRIVKVRVNIGDHVAAGQVLAAMHSHDVHEGRASYQKAQKEVARLKATEEQALRVRDRAKKLYELKAASLEQVEHAEFELKNTRALIEQAEIELTRTKTHLIDFLGVQLDEPEHHAGAEHGDEDFITIKVPPGAGGVVLQRNVTEGSVVQPGGEAFVIADLGTLWMIAAVGEEHFPQLRIGMPASVTVQAHSGRTFTGRISRLGDQLDPATRTIQARIELQNTNGLLKPEMYAEAALSLPGQRAAMFVQETALQEVKGAPVLFVRRGSGAFEAVTVETGRSSGGALEIVHGLKEGDEVVTRGAFALKSALLKSALAEE